MTYCSDCYWAEQCGCLTITSCPYHTTLGTDDPSAEAEYLATVRADVSTYEVTILDDYVGGVSYKSRNPAQRLYF